MTAGSDVFDGLATPIGVSTFGRPHGVPPLDAVVLTSRAINGEQRARAASAAQGGHDTDDVFDFLQTPGPYRDEAGDGNSKQQPAGASPAAGNGRRPGFYMDVNALAEGSLTGARRRRGTAALPAVTCAAGAFIFSQNLAPTFTGIPFFHPFGSCSNRGSGGDRQQPCYRFKARTASWRRCSPCWGSSGWSLHGCHLARGACFSGERCCPTWIWEPFRGSGLPSQLHPAPAGRWHLQLQRQPCQAAPAAASGL